MKMNVLQVIGLCLTVTMALATCMLVTNVSSDLHDAELYATELQREINEYSLEILRLEQIIQDQSDIITKLNNENEELKKRLMELGF